LLFAFCWLPWSFVIPWSLSFECSLSVMQLQLICNNYFSIQLAICLKERIQKRIRFLIEKSNLYFCLRPSELLMTLSDWVFVETTIWIMAFLTAYKEVKILSKYLVRAARRTLLLLIYRRQKQNKNYLWGWGEQKKRKKYLQLFCPAMTLIYHSEGNRVVTS